MFEALLMMFLLPMAIFLPNAQEMEHRKVELKKSKGQPMSIEGVIEKRANNWKRIGGVEFWTFMGSQFCMALAEWAPIALIPRYPGKSIDLQHKSLLITSFGVMSLFGKVNHGYI